MATNKDDPKDYLNANELENSEMSNFGTALNDEIKLASDLLDIFLLNKFDEAKTKLKIPAKSEMYSSLGYSYLLFLQATVTMESEHIDEASKAAKACISLCQKHRKKIALSESLKFKNKSVQLEQFTHYTDYQCHAELCYTECLLVKACLSFLQNENLLGLIKGSLQIRECYKIYKVCWNMLKVKEWHNNLIKSTFETGVRLGVGGFNLMISMLPTRILKILEFVGFKGNKNFGLNEINKAASSDYNLRHPFAVLLLIFYHCYLGVMVELPPFTIQINEAKRILDPMRHRFSSSSLLGMLLARIDMISGKFETALQGYENAIESQNDWRNLHDICYWEMMWCNVFQGDWLLGMKYAEKLSQNSRWSKATYYYQKGAFLLECYSQSTEPMIEDVKTHIKNIFENVPKLLQRIAGKSLPVEKFAAKKSRRFFEQGENLVLPGVELIFIWNGFKIFGGNRSCVEKFLSLCNETLTKLQDDGKETKNSPYYYDNLALTTLLKAVCLKYLNKKSEAINLMNTVLTWHKKVKEDLYLMPYTEMELAQIAFADSRFENAKTHIHNAKSYKGYSLESRLHFRIHGLNDSLHKAMNADRVSISDNPWDHLSVKELVDENDVFHDCDSDNNENHSNYSAEDLNIN